VMIEVWPGIGGAMLSLVALVFKTCFCACLQVIVRLNKGLGVSLVDRTPEELVYVMFHDVAVECVQENGEQSLRADVHSLQVGFVQ